MAEGIQISNCFVRNASNDWTSIHAGGAGIQTRGADAAGVFKGITGIASADPSLVAERKIRNAANTEWLDLDTYASPPNPFPLINFGTRLNTTGILAFNATHLPPGLEAGDYLYFFLAAPGDGAIAPYSTTPVTPEVVANGSNFSVTRAVYRAIWDGTTVNWLFELGTGSSYFSGVPIGIKDYNTINPGFFTTGTPTGGSAQTLHWCTGSAAVNYSNNVILNFIATFNNGAVWTPASNFGIAWQDDGLNNYSSMMIGSYLIPATTDPGPQGQYTSSDADNWIGIAHGIPPAS